MAWAKCVVQGCPMRIRQGTRHAGSDRRGRDLADGRRCWRCRQGITTHIRRAGKSA